MISVTALELVNEWIDMYRYDPVVDFSDPRGRNALRFINKAVDEVLNQNEWDFAHRHDGVMYTHPAISSDGTQTSLAVGTDITEELMPLGGDLLLQLFGAPYAKWLPTELSAHAYALDTPAPAPWVQVVGSEELDTASYKLWTIHTTQGAAGYTTRIGPNATAGANWRGESKSLFDADPMTYTLFAHEYVMPSFVKSVTDVRVQGQQVTLIPVSDDNAYCYVDPAEHISDSLLEMYVGGNTFRYDEPPPADFGGFTVTNPRQLRVMLYPTPETEYMVNYSYLYRFPQLVATTDTLEITPEAASILVDHAFYKAQISQVGNDEKMGQIGMREVRRAIHSALAADEPASRERYTVRPFGEGSRINPRFRWETQKITGL